MNHFERRRLVLEIAANEIGPGRVKDYWRDVLGPGWPTPGSYPEHWCGAFALWCLRQAGLAREVRWLVPRAAKDPSGFLLVKHAIGKMPRVTDPHPGDIAYFDKPFQRHALVESVRAGQLVTIDGNQGSRNGTPIRRVHRSMPGGASFFSIALFLTAAELEGDVQVVEPADSKVPTDPAPPLVDSAPPPSHEVWPTLRRGDSGRGVRELQSRLNAKLTGLIAPLALDGDFGGKTDAAVRELQGLYALKVDGVAGPKTWAVLA